MRWPAGKISPETAPGYCGMPPHTNQLPDELFFRKSMSRQKSKPNLLGNHQRCWIWGRNAVRETILAKRWPIIELMVSTEADDDRNLATEFCQQADTTLRFVTDADITKQCKASDHQGWAAKMTAFPYANEDDFTTAIQQTATNEKRHQTIVLLDHLQDPFNFGAIIRSAAAFNVTGIVIAKNHQVGVTSQVVRSSAGLVNRVPVFHCESLPFALSGMKEAGFTIFAATLEYSVSLTEIRFPHQSCLVIGQEGEGVSADVLTLCDQRIRIPIADEVESLNAAVASGVLFYEVSRQHSETLQPRN